MWVILLHRSKDSCGLGADQLPMSLLNGAGSAREGFSCCSVLWLWACTHSRAGLCGCAGSREPPCCPVALGDHVPTGFPTLSYSSRGLSACIPRGPRKVWAAAILQEGKRLQSLCASWLRQKIWALLWANSATKTSPALQACCCSGNLKPPISNAIISCLLLLLH